MKSTGTHHMSDSEKIRRIEELLLGSFSPALKLLAVAFICYPEATHKAAYKWLAARGTRARQRKSR